MLPRDVDLRLADILKAARKILTHTAGMDADALTTDDWALDAVLHNLAVMVRRRHDCLVPSPTATHPSRGVRRAISGTS